MWVTSLDLWVEGLSLPCYEETSCLHGGTSGNSSALEEAESIFSATGDWQLLVDGVESGLGSLRW